MRLLLCRLRLLLWLLLLRLLRRPVWRLVAILGLLVDLGSVVGMIIVRRQRSMRRWGAMRRGSVARRRLVAIRVRRRRAMEVPASRVATTPATPRVASVGVARGR